MKSQTSTHETAEPETQSNIHAGCPVCEGRSLIDLCPFLLDQEYPRLTRFCDRRKLVLCDACGSVSRYPLEIAPLLDDEAGNYYYAQMRGGENEGRNGADPQQIAAHLDGAQVHHYDHLHEVLRARFAPSAYRRWLDVGSAGYPTIFDDYDFTTVEPSPAAVALGRQRFRAASIRLGTIETLADEAAFDGVIFLDSFYCMTNPRGALARARALLRDEGILVIRMGHYFVETDSTAPDSRYDYLEPVFRGPTVSVYQNRLSLQWLCAQMGFKLVEEFEHRLANLPQKTVYFAIFRLENRTGATAGPSLEEAGRRGRALARGIWEQFTATTVETLREIDRTDFAMVGSPAVMRELEEIRPRERLQVRVDGSNLQAESRQDGLSYATLDKLTASVGDGTVRNVAIADFTDPVGLVDRLRDALGEAVAFWIPTRRSGFPTLRWDGGDASVVTKAFKLKRVRST